MTLLRVVLSVFSILNVAFWAMLAWAWAIKPAWAARLPFKLGTDMRYRTSVPTWARLAAAVAAFWAAAAARYLTVFLSHPLAFISPFVTAALFLTPLLLAAARVFRRRPNPTSTAALH